ncbi:MAG: OmpA family protein [Pseudomonadota bacterium]
MIRKMAAAAMIAGSLAFTGGNAAAQTAESIVNALTPKKPEAVRSFSGGQARGISITGDLPREEELPRIDLTINFEFDSDKLTNDGWIAMQALGEALKDPRLAGMEFRIAGHTDGRGEAGYNQDLSMRRALTVTRHLTQYYSIAPERLYPAGYGESQLMRPDDPAHPNNRRVEIINLSPMY